MSPQNKLIFLLGPTAGTTMFGSNRYAVYFVSPLTGGYCECYSGGNVTPQFARTGYKVVILEGASDGRSSSRSRSGAPPSTLPTTCGASTPLRRKRGCRSRPACPRLRPASSGRPARTWCASPASRTTSGTVWGGAVPARSWAPRRSRAWSSTATAPSRWRARRRSRRWSRTWRRAAGTTPGWPPIVAAAPSTWCAPQQRPHLSHALLDQGQARGLRAAHRGVHARALRPGQRHLPALHHAVPQAQHRAGGPPPRRPADRGSRVRDDLRLRGPVRDRRLRRDHVPQRHLRPSRRGHHVGRQPLRAGDRSVPARHPGPRPHLGRRRRRGRLPQDDDPPRRGRRPVRRGDPERSKRSSACRMWPCTSRAWSRPATTRAS